MSCRGCKSDEAPINGRCPYCRLPVEEIVTPIVEERIEPVQNIPVQDVNTQVPTQQIQPKKNNKKILIIILVLLVLGLCAFGYINHKNSLKEEDKKETESSNKIEPEEEEIEEPEENDEPTESHRTIMVYMIGSDLESKGRAGSNDIKEMLKAEYDKEDISVVLYIGGAKRWHMDEIDEDENAIYEIDGDELKKVKSYKVKPMTNKNTLTEFIDYTYENYDSDKYSLILWDHGGGPIWGYGVDENDASEDMLSIKEIDEALNNSELIKNEKLEFLGFDACLMSSIEIANAYKEEAEYLLASSELEPGDGWDYTFLNEINKDTVSEQMGILIVDYYYNFYTADFSGSYGYQYMPSVTLSLIDLSKIDTLVTSVNDLFSTIEPNINITTYNTIARSASRTKMYGYNNSSDIQEDLLDLYGLVYGFEGYESKVSQVHNSIRSAVVYHKTNIKGCTGLSIYFPVTQRQYYQEIKEELNYKEVTFSDTYYNFIDSYVKISNGDTIVKSNISDLTPTVSSGEISAILPDDVVENYETADYIIFRKIQKDGSFLPIYYGNDVVFEGNKIKAEVSDRRIAVSDLNGEGVEDIIVIEDSRDDKTITYYSAAVIQRWDDEDPIGTYEIEAVDLYINVDIKSGEAKITDIRIMEDELSSKKSVNLNEWDTITFVSYSYILHDENGNILDDPQETETIYGTEIDIKEGYKLYTTKLDQNEEYYYMFRVKDTQGNLYRSNLVKAK